MCIPLDLNILPKTLLKLASPHYKRATKFKSKKFNNTNKASQASQASYNNNILSSLPITTSYATSINNYRLILTTFKLLVVALTSLLSLSLSCKRSIAQFLRRTVILNLLFLMKDFRLKSLYQKTIFNTKSNISNNKSKLISSSTSLSSTISSTVIIDLKLFSQNYKNNHRTYNNSSKSNKVFLYYTPRDPRLRYFNRQTFLNKHFVIVKSDSDRSDKSQLKITEDLCNYGELIGGYKKILNCNLATKSNSNCKNINKSGDNLISESENNCDSFKFDIANVGIKVDSKKIGDKKILERITLLNDFLQQRLSSILKHTLSSISSEGFFLTTTGIVI